MMTLPLIRLSFVYTSTHSFNGCGTHSLMYTCYNLSSFLLINTFFWFPIFFYYSKPYFHMEKNYAALCTCSRISLGWIPYSRIAKVKYICFNILIMFIVNLPSQNIVPGYLYPGLYQQTVRIPWSLCSFLTDLYIY